MLPTSRTHPRLHRRNPQINFLIVTNQSVYVLKDSDLFFSQHFKKIVGRFNGHTIERYNESPSRIPLPRANLVPLKQQRALSTLSRPSPAQCTLARLRLQKPHCRGANSGNSPTTFKSSSPSKQGERQGATSSVSRRFAKCRQSALLRRSNGGDLLPIAFRLSDATHLFLEIA